MITGPKMSRNEWKLAKFRTLLLPRHGNGSYSWANGDQRGPASSPGGPLPLFNRHRAVVRYHGIWRDGPRHGEGVFISSDGVEEKRVYNNGLLVLVNGQHVPPASSASVCSSPVK